MNDFPNPLVSIIVPSYNQGKFIRHTIESILTQNYSPLEVIVVDGASTDETVEMLSAFDGGSRVRWMSEPDRGVVDAVNKGFKLARGDLLAIQSSDDAYRPGAMAHAVAALQANPSVGLVYADVAYVDARGQEIGRSHLYRYALTSFLSKKTWIPQPTAFFRAALRREVGGWDESVPYTPDADLWLRLVARAGALKIDECWGELRCHEEQRDTCVDKIRRDWNRMIDQSDDVRQMPWYARRAAQAGKHLTACRYSDGNDWAYTYHLWASLWYWPPLITATAGLRTRLLPGYMPMRIALSRLKQRFLRSRRTRASRA